MGFVTAPRPSSHKARLPLRTISDPSLALLQRSNLEKALGNAGCTFQPSEWAAFDEIFATVAPKSYVQKVSGLS